MWEYAISYSGLKKIPGRLPRRLYAANRAEAFRALARLFDKSSSIPGTVKVVRLGKVSRTRSFYL